MSTDADFQAADWRRHLQRAAPKRGEAEGKLFGSYSNLVLILRHDEVWRDVIAYDEFGGRVVKRHRPPFERGEVGEWQDSDDLHLRLWMSAQYGINPRKDDLFDAVQAVADVNRFHEVRSYLEGLVWDGVPRLKHLLQFYMGAEPGEYASAVGTKWMLSAVARVFRPGCKADHVLILEGPQGLGKSTFLSIMGGPWFTDAPFRLGDREGWMVIRGKWIVELGELDSFNKAESTAAKQFFGQYIDRFRTPWGKRPADVPRQQVFAGTTNQSIYLKDETGNRRYWPVRVTALHPAELREDRDQIWAEAVHLYREGAVWHVQEAERPLFEDAQAARMVPDAYETTIARWLERERPELKGEDVTMADILGDALKLDVGRWTRVEQIRVGQVMSRLGWQRKRGSPDETGRREWVYVRPETVGGRDA